MLSTCEQRVEFLKKLFLTFFYSTGRCAASMSSEYSIAMFEDGRTDIIPNYWIQDYLKKDNDALQPTDVKNRGKVLQNKII